MKIFESIIWDTSKTTSSKDEYILCSLSILLPWITKFKYYSSKPFLACSQEIFIILNCTFSFLMDWISPEKDLSILIMRIRLKANSIRKMLVIC